MTTTRADRAARIARETKFITASEDYDYPPRVDRLIQDAADLIAEYAAAESADDLAITGRFTTVEELNKHLSAERAAANGFDSIGEAIVAAKKWRASKEFFATAAKPAPAPESEAIAILRELIRTEDWRPARAYLATLAQSQAQGESEKARE